MQAWQQTSLRASLLQKWFPHRALLATVQLERLQVAQEPAPLRFALLKRQLSFVLPQQPVSIEPPQARMQEHSLDSGHCAFLPESQALRQERWVQRGCLASLLLQSPPAAMV